MMTLTLDLPADVAERLAPLPENERTSYTVAALRASFAVGNNAAQKRRDAGKRLIVLLDDMAAQGINVTPPMTREEMYADREY